MNGSKYKKIPLRSSTFSNFENDDKFCFLWLITAKLHSCENSHHIGVPNCTQNFDELNIERLDIFNGFICSNVPKLEILNFLSKNIIELGFCRCQIERKHKVFPTEISKIFSEKVFAYLRY